MDCNKNFECPTLSEEKPKEIWIFLISNFRNHPNLQKKNRLNSVGYSAFYYELPLWGIRLPEKYCIYSRKITEKHR